MELNGWSNPGRTIGDYIHDQILKVARYLQNQAGAGAIWDKRFKAEMSNALKETESAIRMVTPFMQGNNILFPGALKANAQLNPNHLLTVHGEILVGLINIEKIAKETGLEPELYEPISKMYRAIYARGFLYRYARKPRVHVARAIFRALERHRYLEQDNEWFLLMTIITEDDNSDQEAALAKAITDYRAGKITINKDEAKNKNGPQYWRQQLEYTGLIKTVDKRTIISDEFPYIVKALTDPDFFGNLRKCGQDVMFEDDTDN